MSTIQTVMRFELLPNEMIIECFGYLNAVDIFHSFDELNYRFYKLIRYISLNLDTQTIPRLKLDQFYKKMFSNPEMKKQIYSLQLSNKSTYCQIHTFFSDFSLHEFSNLRSLTLGEMVENDASQLKLMLPLLSQLSCLRLINCENKYNEILSILQICKIRTLTVPTLFLNDQLTYDISSIINLTISSCNTNQLHQILNNASRLKYLNIHHFVKLVSKTTKTNVYTIKHHITHLKQLTIMQFDGVFRDLLMILQETPNLKSLTIGSQEDIDMIDANQWQYFITSSLPYLNTFKFNFTYSLGDKKNSMHEKWTQFQGDFWHKQHHWYTEYSLSMYSASIYTIPYISERFVLNLFTVRYYNKLMSNMNPFDYITDVVIYPDTISEKCQYYFPNVTSLELRELSLFANNSLNMVVNLSNVQDLKISSSCKLKMPFILLQILKQAPQILSISIHKDDLILLFENEELCKYLNKMIKKLNILHLWKDLFYTSDKRNQFCEIFSNIEQLICEVELPDSLLFVLKGLPKLSYINVSLASSTTVDEINSFIKEVRKLDEKIFIDIQRKNNTNRSISMIRYTD